MALGGGGSIRSQVDLGRLQRELQTWQHQHANLERRIELLKQDRKQLQKSCKEIEGTCRQALRRPPGRGQADSTLNGFDAPSTRSTDPANEPSSNASARSGGRNLPGATHGSERLAAGGCKRRTPSWVRPTPAKGAGLPGSGLVDVLRAMQSL